MERVAELKALLERRDAEFWPALRRASRAASEFDEWMRLITLRKRAVARGLADVSRQERIRLALVGGYSLFPLHELVSLALFAAGFDAEIFCGEYDNYVAEIIEPSSDLYAFDPQVALLMPPDHRYAYRGALVDPADASRRAVKTAAAELLALCQTLHERSRAEVLLCNFLLPARFDLGPLRSRRLGSEWTFRKSLNLEVGLAAPSYVHVCDLEFLGARRGGLASRDDKWWFESKQVGSPPLLVDVAREVVQLVQTLRRSPKKVLVLDLDNTLWGGVIGDDGVEGIELGDTSPRGEAFKAFQTYILSLKARGVLLAVASKNEPSVAADAIARHAEMVLRLDDFVAFKVGWGPKSEGLRQIAEELNLGLDSFVFVDDNAAEIEIVRQFAPEVATILLGPDPAEYRATLADCRLFEPHAVTEEDAQRTQQYKREAARNVELTSATDMDAYLRSLEMVAVVRELDRGDVPRVAQLINKSNQFNVTTRRRTEAEVTELLDAKDRVCLTVRLADRFGDHGLISVVVLECRDSQVYVDTWLMSCRVLKRQVEEEIVNRMMRVARERGASRVRGEYIATAKNAMVRDLYARMGFRTLSEDPTRGYFEADVDSFVDKKTWIRVKESDHESS